MKRTSVVLLACLAVGVASGLVWGASPIITSADIDRTLRINAPGSVCYDEKIVVRVSDADYTADLACVTITDSEDPANAVTLSMCEDGVTINNSAASFTWIKRGLPGPPRSAPYTFSVRDFEYNTDTLSTDAPPAMPGVHMSVVAPAMDSVITSLVPTFQWQNANAATELTTRIDVYEDFKQSSLWYKSITGGLTSTVFASGGTSPYRRTQLLANHSYVWTVNSGTNSPVYTRPGDPVTGYHKVIVRDWQELHGRFSVYGAWAMTPPALGGKLAYGLESVATLTTSNWGVTGIMGYGTDPTTRTWLGPEAANDPDWSPDGSTLLYATPMGLYTDDFSGAGPQWVPGTTGADGPCRWTADGSGIIFGRNTAGDPFGRPRDSQLWMMDRDGGNAHAIVSGQNYDLTFSPSPDGAWVAYQSWNVSGAGQVRVVRVDGTDDHAVAATGVVGRDAAYVVSSLTQPAWSPDGVTLAVIFNASAAGLPALVGVGTVPAAGGPVTPQFVSPYAQCCAAPRNPVWSPDGSAVVFTSGHHRPDLYNYDTIWAAELWMVKTDGSAPVRLTDDYSLNRNVAWWGMNTPAGAGVPFRRGDVRVIFETVTAAGMSDVVSLGLPVVPAPPGLEYLGKSYEVSTTAQYAGAITVEVFYQDADLPTGQQESDLVLLHWENGQWVNVTAGPVDTVANVVRGSCSGLGTFALAVGGGTPLPAAEFTGNPRRGAAPLKVYFTDASTGDPTSWSWEFGDGAVSAEQHPSHTYALAGTYSVALTATNAGGPDTETKVDYITVMVPLPVASFSATPVRGSMPLAVSFTDQSTGAVTQRLWEFGDGATSQEQHPSHTYTSVGTYAVALTVFNESGSDTCAKAGLIAVLPQPPVAQFSASPLSGVTPLAVQFTDASTGEVAARQWDFGDGSVSTEPSPSHTYTAVGVYSVSLTVSNDGGTSTCAKSGLITVLPQPPVASFTVAPASGCAPLTVAFTDTSGGVVTSRLWDFGDGTTSTQQNPTHVYSSAGSYTVSLTAANAGGAATATVAGCVTAYQFIGPLDPIDPAGSSVFKGRTSVPVRVQVLAPDGSPVTGLDIRLFASADGGASYDPALGYKHPGNAFDYDARAQYYEFPLDTKSMADGVWSLKVTVNGAQTAVFQITLGKAPRGNSANAHAAVLLRRGDGSASPRAAVGFRR